MLLSPDGVMILSSFANYDLHLSIVAEVPKGTSDLCPRLNGFYAHPDPAVCTKFYSCVEGDAEEYTCSPGLWFDDYKGVCNWPEDSERKQCSAGKNISRHCQKLKRKLFFGKNDE